MEDYDCGLINDYGGGNVEWWRNYIKAEVTRANEWWRNQVIDGEEAFETEIVKLHRKIKAEFARLKKERAELARECYEQIEKWTWGPRTDDEEKLLAKLKALGEEG